MYAEYHARDWAENKSNIQILEEINRLKQNVNFQWNEVGNAHHRYLRMITLQKILKERI